MMHCIREDCISDNHLAFHNQITFISANNGNMWLTIFSYDVFFSSCQLYKLAVTVETVIKTLTAEYIIMLSLGTANFKQNVSVGLQHGSM